MAQTLFQGVESTVLRNPTITDQYYGIFNNGMGLTIGANSTVTVPYDVFNPAGSWAYNRTDYNAILKSLVESGKLEILATPQPIYYDANASVDDGVVLSSANLAITAAALTATSSDSSSDSGSGSDAGSGSGSGS